MVLSWGGPTIRIWKCLADGTLPERNTWKVMPEIVNGTTQLNTEEGETTEAIDEDGNVVDVLKKASKFTLAFTLFGKKGDKKPIADVDGVIEAEYGIEVTPHDPNCIGIRMDKCRVSVVETFTAADGVYWAYTFSGLKPTGGNICKHVVNGEVVPESDEEQVSGSEETNQQQGKE